MMDLDNWFRMPDGLEWTSFVFIALLVAASWIQEKETLIRFGDAAAAYYARTPRIPFLPIESLHSIRSLLPTR